MAGFGVVDNTVYTLLNGFTIVDLGIEKGNNAYTKIYKLGLPFSTSNLQTFN